MLGIAGLVGAACAVTRPQPSAAPPSPDLRLTSLVGIRIKNPVTPLNSGEAQKFYNTQPLRLPMSLG